MESPSERNALVSKLASQMDGKCYFSHAYLEPLDDESSDSEADLQQLGYSTAHTLSGSGSNREVWNHLIAVTEIK